MTIDPAPVTLTVTGAQVYGSAPAFAASTGISGLTAGGVICTGLSDGTGIAASVPVGSYRLDGTTCSGATLSSANYAVAGYAGSSFAVYRAALTVTANDQQRTYRTANPTFGYAVTGFVNGDDASVLTGSPALATTATTGSDAGTYPITVAAGSLVNGIDAVLTR